MKSAPKRMKCKDKNKEEEDLPIQRRTTRPSQKNSLHFISQIHRLWAKPLCAMRGSGMLSSTFCAARPLWRPELSPDISGCLEGRAEGRIRHVGEIDFREDPT